MKGIGESTRNAINGMKSHTSKEPSIRSNAANRISANSVSKRVGAKPGDNAEKAMESYMNKRGIGVSDARSRK